MSVPYIWHPGSGNAPPPPRVFAWRHMILPGFPRDAKAYMMISGKFWLYINGTLTSSDTVGKRNAGQLDSIVGIASLVRGGDNDICLHVINMDSTFRGCSILFTSLLDTSQHFSSSGKYARQVAAASVAKVSGAPNQDRNEQISATQGGRKSGATAKTSPKELSYDKQFRNRGELLKATVEYQKKAEISNFEVKKERLEVQKLRIKGEDLDEQIRKTKDETSQLKKQLEGMSRTK